MSRSGWVVGRWMEDCENQSSSAGEGSRIKCISRAAETIVQEGRWLAFGKYKKGGPRTVGDWTANNNNNKDDDKINHDS